MQKKIDYSMIFYYWTKYKILYTRDYGGEFDVTVQMDPETANEVKTMGCVKWVNK
jgi:hypothetical protein